MWLTKKESESELEQEDVGEALGAKGTRLGFGVAGGRCGERVGGVRGARRELSSDKFSVGSSVKSEVSTEERSGTGSFVESTGGSVDVDAVPEATCFLVIGARLVVLPTADD